MLRLTILLLFGVFHCSMARHLQFQLSGYECFYEEIEEKAECSLEFAPITGNDPKIDVTLEDPNGEILYKADKKDYDLHKFTAKINGTYRVCFSNVFDFSIGENLVYFDFVTGKDTSFDTGAAPTDKALTQLETSLSTIHENMNLVERYQNYHRLREANGRLAADHLNHRVQWWSIGQSVIVVAVGMTQVFVLRRFFTVGKQDL
ncbi:transmembrane emp24 domain-containing protein 7 [Exaiptasia diaphana]|uniref:GOLD domain-containing protein n=1 Tax=Exaiptasia diaphana TaxID=2652724 RepID=A0A913XZW1_EXADI|nr:transmembrane emp24 domain-containing protein 7 [Exaiptasia diaphana]KXJ23855.1 Transmembrane emp24 domain-containing protein 7 [Exaiptasia diaphana]